SGNKLFKPTTVTPKTYAYSPEEQAFYDRLTGFILSGQAYASSLNQSDQRLVRLVLTAMQKLAASSVAAIRSAIRGRITRLADSRERLTEIDSRMREMIGYLNDGSIPALDDRYVALEEEYAETSVKVALVENELPMLEELLALAAEVNVETKIETLLEILKTDFEGRTVVFFTEYKATQAMLINTLNREFGNGCASFINGDGRLDNVIQPDGKLSSWHMDRYDAAEKFKNGDVRFIVCTEAGGEGIDLQDNCHSMIHVDLPWNPMRLHQRVGRLNRYGQKHGVDVITLRNPDTVESRIWSLLNEKIESVMRALGTAMDEPEDLLQLILGMTDASIFNQLFAGGIDQNPDNLRQWFDAKAGTFGGHSAVSAVASLVGHADKFEYEDLDEVPKQDLVDLAHFFESMLKLNGHRLAVEDGKMSFVTPKAWQNQYGIRRKYNNLVFNRTAKGSDVNILGIGHPILDNALSQAEQFPVSLAVAKGIEHPVFIFQLRDQVTSERSNFSYVIVAVVLGEGGPSLLKEEALMRFYCTISDAMPKSKEIYLQSSRNHDLSALLVKAEEYLAQNMTGLTLNYRLPTYELVAGFTP
ncbi:MAG: helicase SNF2, partial [Gammaproteobacteria bacterium]